jgi:hypothetical protein
VVGMIRLGIFTLRFSLQIAIGPDTNVGFCVAIQFDKSQATALSRVI